LKQIQEQNPQKKLELWYQDETRFGQKTRTGKILAKKGSAPRYIRQTGFKNAYIFGSVNPETGQRVGLIGTHCDSDFMNSHLLDVSAALNPEVHAILICDGAGWHSSSSLNVPSNISVFLLPPYSPELNPIERLWLYLKEKYLAFRTFNTVAEIIDVGCQVWNTVSADEIKSVCHSHYSI
jgi:hypothetical protein